MGSSIDNLEIDQLEKLMTASKNRIFLNLDGVDFWSILKRSEDYNEVLCEEGLHINNK